MNNIILKIHSLIAGGAPVSTDTRKIQPGSVFFALKGENFDANDFALKAIEQGAVAAIVDKPTLPENENFIRVDNVLITLQQLAHYHRMQFNIPVIGITGSNGKTTSKELINAVLSKKFNTLCTIGNLNNHIGVPLTLLNLQKHHQVAIVEMGANHMGEIHLLSEIAQPTHGMITNVGKAHIEGFGSFENIIKGKTELYRNIQKNNGTIFINGDNKILTAHAQPDQCISYGAGNSNRYRGEVISASPLLEVMAYLPHRHGNPVLIKSNLLGSYNFENIMAAVAIGDFFDVPLNLIRTAIENYIPTNSRSQLKETGKNTLILDAYNANPTSMRAAIENFNLLQTPLPKALVLGDMLEMGDTAAKEHQDIIDLIHSNQYSFVILVGREFNRLLDNNETHHSFSDTSAAKEWLEKNPPSGNIILVKGSRGIHLEKLEELF